jgi:hypothetical protein
MGNRLVEADLEFSGGAVQVKAVHPLFQLSVPSFAPPLYDVSADGSRFLNVQQRRSQCFPIYRIASQLGIEAEQCKNNISLNHTDRSYE